MFVCLRGEFTRGDLRGAALAFSALAVAASPASRLILAASKRMGEAPVGASAEAFPRVEASLEPRRRGPHGGLSERGVIDLATRLAPAAAAAAAAAADSSASFAARRTASMWALLRWCGFPLASSSPSFTVGCACPQPCRLQS